jgi:P4 family phage/plasmid primase-like protien
MSHTLGTGRIVPRTEQQALYTLCFNQWGGLDRAATSNIIDFYNGSPAQQLVGPGSICFQAVAPDRGYWRYWDGTHWALYNEVLLEKDLSWLTGNDLNDSQVRRLNRTMKVRLAVPHDKFDQKPIVVFQNCVLEVKGPPLAAGGGNRSVAQYQPGFRPEDYITVVVPVEYKSVPTPKWDELLGMILPDEQDRKTLQELFGYCFFPSVQLQVFFALVGDAGTGKSTILAVLSDMLGEERITNIRLSSLHDSHATSGLVGSLVNIDNEAEYLDPKSEANLKGITGGDKVNINPKNLPLYSARLPTKFILVCNEMPKFADRTEGVWSRLVQLPMCNKIPEGIRKEIGTVLQDLRPEYPGILHWALGGLQRVLKRGTRASAFTQSEEALCQIAEHKIDSNPFLQWFEIALDSTLTVNPH